MKSKNFDLPLFIIDTLGIFIGVLAAAFWLINSSFLSAFWCAGFTGYLVYSATYLLGGNGIDYYNQMIRISEGYPDKIRYFMSRRRRYRRWMFAIELFAIVGFSAVIVALWLDKNILIAMLFLLIDGFTIGAFLKLIRQTFDEADGEVIS